MMQVCLYGQGTSQTKDSLQLVFYNVENLFDLDNDSETEDDEFTPAGKRYWTKKKYERKLNKISQSIFAFSNYKAPEIIGLCEIENKIVLLDLLGVQLFRKQAYKILHADSRDNRGIDVALLYDSIKTKPIFVDFIPTQIENGNFSRDILYAKMLVKSDTLHLFLNHWPSRYSGARETAHFRLKLAEILISKCDSILDKDSQANIILFGDFNDEPNNKSIQSITAYRLANSDEEVFYNLMIKSKIVLGTIKFQGIWNMFDQFIVSSNLKDGHGKFRIRNTSVANDSFLFEDDSRYMGLKPYRTYSGFKYTGGFSDHLPIKLVLEINR